MSNPNVTVDRHKYVGGSDLPSILGLNVKYGTSIFEFAKEKAGIIANSFKGNQYTKYGQKMEPVIRDYINSIYGVNYLEDTAIDSNRGYRGNTDGIDREAEVPILEVKTFGNELAIDYYMAQCQFYMETFNQDACLLVGYKRPTDFYTGVDYDLENDDGYFNLNFDENNIVQHIINRDSDLWSKIEDRIIAFKTALEKLKENNDMTEEQFNKLFYGTDLIEMSDKLLKLENKLNNMKKIDNEYKKAKDELYKLFEDKCILSFDTGSMKITKVAPTSYDTVTIDIPKLKKENEAIYNKYKVKKTTNKKGYILITVKKEV
ncbi:MAG: YqaJ viral recombinase family protein [Bacilli bacterium]